MLNAQFLRLAVDALTSGTLGINGVIERSIAVERDPLDTSPFPVDIFHTAFSLGELFVFTRLPGFLWKEQGTLEALGMISVGVIELLGGMHRQADRTLGSAISQTSKGSLAMLVEWDSGNAAVASRAFVDISCII